jgi:chloramphenicol 3-O-phosphotransferase
LPDWQTATEILMLGVAKLSDDTGADRGLESADRHGEWVNSDRKDHHWKMDA